MNSIQNKLEIIRKLLDEIEGENHLTDLFAKINPSSRKTFDDFSIEQICFDLVKKIIDQENLPKNVFCINVYMDSNNQITKYELISSFAKEEGDVDYINIIWIEE